jgi:hypothetical protein
MSWPILAVAFVAVTCTAFWACVGRIVWALGCLAFGLPLLMKVFL